MSPDPNDSACYVREDIKAKKAEAKAARDLAREKADAANAAAAVRRRPADAKVSMNREDVDAREESAAIAKAGAVEPPAEPVFPDPTEPPAGEPPAA